MPSLPERSLSTSPREGMGTVAVARPPLAMAWVLLLASTVAIFVVGLVATILVFRNLPDLVTPIPVSLWASFGLACALTVASLAIRTFRWMFLLRRSETRIPLRDACIGYLSGLSLLLAPLLVGEIAVRTAVLRTRVSVPVETTILLTLWDRFHDVVALVLIAALLGLSPSLVDVRTLGSLAIVGLTVFRPVRQAVLGGLGALARVAATPFHREQHPPEPAELLGWRQWLVGLCTSVLAWVLPGVAFWMLADLWEHGMRLPEAVRAYALSSVFGGLELAPGGVLVVGGRLLDALEAEGIPAGHAAWSIVAIRLATIGVSTVLGGLFLLVHWRTRATDAASHFDAIADAYDVQIPEGRRLALLESKTTMMATGIRRLGVGPRGLDVGCGQGAYVVRMREMGFDVLGIDNSPGQIEQAMQKVGSDGLVSVGSVLDLPANDESYDFAYVINVLHHLPSVSHQRRAFDELFRVLRPGGLLFVHEINTRNVLFRFYMGYVFPSLNCIDEGVERWLLPHRLRQYTEQQVIDVKYFTFLPDFVPQVFASILRPVERALESSRLAVYSAHYMAVLRKGPSA